MIYLDANATTELSPEAFEAMRPFFMERFGNPSSRHGLGVEARAAVENARARVAAFVQATPGELAFTSSGTEAVGLAFQCALGAQGLPVVISAAEHACVLEAAEAWKRRGRAIHVLPVDESGLVAPEVLADAVTQSGPAFVSLIWVNNETGVIAPVEELAKVCTAHGSLLHVDAIQAPARVQINLRQLACAYLSISAHKFNGPKGAGALFVRSGAPRSALLPGHQEGGLRGGTENVPAIVGMGAALATHSQWAGLQSRVATLRDQLEDAVLRRVPQARVNGLASARVANTSSIYFPGKSAADMVAGLARSGVCVSAGAACTTGGSPSHVLRAMGFSEARANGSVRFSLGTSIQQAEIERAVDAIVHIFNSIPATGSPT